MKKFTLNTNYKSAGDQPQAIEKLTRNIQNGCQKQTLLGITGSGKTFTMAKVIETLNRPAIILAHNKTLAAQLYSEMKGFFPNNAVEYFVSYYDYYQPEAYVASSDTYIAKDASINEQIEQMRLSATKSILERKDVIIIASVSAIYGLGDPKLYMKMVLPLKMGDIVSPRQVTDKLIGMQYKRLTTHLERGCFRIQGDVIDIFPAESEKKAIRIELFDEEVEKILSFDPLTNEIFEVLPHTTIFPKTHYSTPKEILQKAIVKIEAELKERLIELKNNNKLVETQRLEERTRFDIEMIQEMGYCTGIENYSRYLSIRAPGEPPATLMDYLPENSLLFVDESHMTLPQIRGMHLGDKSRKLNLVEHGFRLPSALDNRPLIFHEFEKRMPETIFVSATPGEYELASNIPTIEQIIRPTGLLDPLIKIRPVRTQVDDLYEEIQKTVKKGQRVLVTTLTKRMAENLTNYLHDHNVKVRYLHSDIDSIERVEIIRSLRMGKCDVIVGINLLREGLDMPEVSLVAILDADKEGFLRSYRALIQTIGRAARNINGHVILYADKITNSIQKAMDETKRRRTKQLQYNKIHKITPTSIQKQMIELIPGLDPSAQASIAQENKNTTKRNEYSKIDLLKMIKQLEKSMKQHAKLLEFEKAAAVRNQIAWLKQQLLQA